MLLITALLLLAVHIRADPDPTSPIITISLMNVTVSQGQRAQVILFSLFLSIIIKII